MKNNAQNKVLLVEHKNCSKIDLTQPIAAAINHIRQYLPSGHSRKDHVGRIRDDGHFGIFYFMVFVSGIYHFSL